jgi:hypothetical protein
MTGFDEDFSSEMDDRGRKAPRTVTVGWTVRAAKAGLIWPAPRSSYSRQ